MIHYCSSILSITFILIAFCLQPVKTSAQGLFESALNASSDSTSPGGILHGGIRSINYTGFDRESDEPVLQALYGQFNIIADVPAGSYGSAYADIRFRTGTEFGENFSEIALREAWVSLYLGPLEFKSGKQMHTWGVASFVNPSDRFSPENPVLRSPDQDDLRLGVWSLKADMMIGNNSSLELLWLPVYRPSVLLTSPFNMPEYIEILPWDGQQISFNESGFGLRYDLRSSLLDLQLSYYNGYRENPALVTDTAIFDQTTFEPALVRITREPVRIHSVGLNLTVPAGSYLLRTEIGWTDPVNGQVPGSTLPELAYAFEIEQSGGNVSFIAGYYGKYIHDFEAIDVESGLFNGDLPAPSDLFPAGTPPDINILQDYMHNQVTGFNRLYEYQGNELMHAAYVIADIPLFHDRLGLEIPGMYNFTTKELTLMPSVEFNITDGLSARVGAFYLHGEEGSLFNLVSPSLNAMFLGLEMKF